MFPSLPCLRSFSSPASTPFKRSQLGLFGGKVLQYGNNVPFSKKKTRRTWLPNVQRKGLYSNALGGEIRTKVTTRVLRTIKKFGGLDHYLLSARSEELGFEGVRLRILVRQALEAKKADAKGGSSVEDALRERHRLISRLQTNSPPTLKDARRERLAAIEEMRAEGYLGQDELLTDARRLVAYLDMKREQQQAVLASRTVA